MNAREKLRMPRWAAVFVGAMLLISFVSCGTREEEPLTGVTRPYFINLLPVPDKPDQSAKKLENGYKEKAAEMNQLNAHAFGWLQMPGTSLDDVVMYAPEESDPDYYLRRGFNKMDLFAGSYYIDTYDKFDGTREGMSQNIIIYGHSMGDNPDLDLFSQFKRLLKEDWAKEHPYIYFSTMEEDMAWEVFAAFDTHVSFIYNVSNPTREKFQEIVEGARERSFFDYDVEVGQDDKIITLSTCIYDYFGTTLVYPNNYRYVVMARLVPIGEELKETATLAPNPSPKIDKA